MHDEVWLDREWERIMTWIIHSGVMNDDFKWSEFLSEMD